MNAHDLDAKLSEMLSHDGIAADADTLRAATNAAYRSLCQTTKRNRLKVRLEAVPEISAPADLGEVVVAMPVLGDGTPQFWMLEKVWYPDEAPSGLLSPFQWELREATLLLLDLTTDGTATVTVEGLATPEPLVNDSDVPVLIPVDCQMAICWAAYCEWASVYATTPEQWARIEFLQKLVLAKQSLLMPRVRPRPLQRAPHVPAISRIGVP